MALCLTYFSVICIASFEMTYKEVMFQGVYVVITYLLVPNGLNGSFLLPTLTGLHILQTGASQTPRLHTALRPGEDNGKRILLSARKFTYSSLRQNHAGSRLGHPPRDVPVSCDMVSQDFLEHDERRNVCLTSKCFEAPQESSHP